MAICEGLDNHKGDGRCPNGVLGACVAHAPRTNTAAQRGAFLFSLISAAAAYSADAAAASLQSEKAEECEAPPRVVNFNAVVVGPATFCQDEDEEVSQLGDGIRSSEASGVFFDQLDIDGDGSVEPNEMAMFLRDEIGGTQFDTQSEVDSEVDTIMERLDQNHNDGLEMSDMLNYWTQLESLLTAEEVAEWIVYSVQLPKSIGRIFLENGITGYDFVEIVDNGGHVMQNELGIDKSSFRNKIVRQMQARMLGIGSTPSPPQQLSHRLESCKAVSLSWKKSSARVFPVHSYRIQRRDINLFGHHNQELISDSHRIDESFSASSRSDWRTVYVGGDDEFVDSGLQLGHNYMYRIQAWNSVGRSSWEVLDISHDLKRQRCSTRPSFLHNAAKPDRSIPPSAISINEGIEWLSIPRKLVWGLVVIVQVTYNALRFFFAFIALMAGIIRFRRASASSSANVATTLPYPWLWKGLNKVSKKFIGAEIIPRTMLGDRDALIEQEKLHDEQMMTTGLRGYDRLRLQKLNVEKAPLSRRSSLKKNHSTGDISRGLSVSFAPPKEIIVTTTSPPSKVSKYLFSRSPRKSSESVESTDGSHTSSQSSNTRRAKFSGSSLLTARSTEHPNGVALRNLSQGRDDDNICSECTKRFKIGKRYKHHCCRCMATFCHKCGKTTHSNFTSCKVPGDCICNSCLDELSARKKKYSTDRSRVSSSMST
mmetsp:Transcript_1850/g.4312  ORF Transcript_1850/g.4312 Transcript_1850/m.4312 type:complete len:709 (+) Transcript_1850:127-2253(+)